MAPGPRYSDEYKRHREKLLEAERALRDQTEGVAALRRELPPGPVMRDDYVLEEGPVALTDEDPGAIRSIGLGTSSPAGTTSWSSTT